MIEGLASPAGAPEGTRHVAFYSKVHHAALDGAAGVALATAIMDVTAVPRAVRPAPNRRAMATDNFGIAELAVAGIKNTAVQSAKLAKNLPGWRALLTACCVHPKAKSPAWASRVWNWSIARKKTAGLRLKRLSTSASPTSAAFPACRFL